MERPAAVVVPTKVWKERRTRWETTHSEEGACGDQKTAKAYGWTVVVVSFSENRFHVFSFLYEHMLY